MDSQSSVVGALFLATSVICTLLGTGLLHRKRARIDSLKGIAIVTRIHGEKSLDAAINGKLYKFIESVIDYGDKIIICIGCETLSSLLIYQERIALYIKSLNYKDDKIIVLPIFPWGRFVSALNASLREVLDQGNNRMIMFQSLEFFTDKAVVDEMIDQMLADDNILVIGPTMNGHVFQEGKMPLSGRTCPWNTCAIWDLEKLHILGFPFIGDGLFNSGSETGGVEEVSTVAILQAINPSWKAILLKISPYLSNWEDTFLDPQRAEYHEKKMKSKDDRPRAHLQKLGLSGWVHHIVVMKR